MSTTPSKYITTTLPYANGPLEGSAGHIGHALEFIQADTIARFQRSNGIRPYFNLGLDENGSKIYKTAKGLGLTAQQYVDLQFEQWKKFCDKLGIQYDSFYRTSDAKHHESVSRFWNECLERGDLYKAEYTKKYCEGCESFKEESELENGRCPDHPSRDIEEITEENWFFRIEKYKQQLLYHYEANQDFLIPQTKMNELVNLIKGAKDISVSRLKTAVPWGVDVPNDPEQVIYVWFEALTNYIFAAGYYDDKKKFETLWPTTLQICGPDNLKFQALTFQTFLLSAGIQPTKNLLVHGTVLDKNGHKMSKSEGNVVNPFEQIEKYGLDAVRYYTIAGISTCDNGAWSEEDLAKMYNARLANEYGNLLARTVHLISKNGTKAFFANNDFRVVIMLHVKAAENAFHELRLKDACEEVSKLLQYGNKYMTDLEPWKLEDPTEVLSNLHELLIQATLLLGPVIPTSAGKAMESLLSREKIILFPRLQNEKTPN